MFMRMRVLKLKKWLIVDLRNMNLILYWYFADTKNMWKNLKQSMIITTPWAGFLKIIGTISPIQFTLLILSAFIADACLPFLKTDSVEM